MIPTLNLKNICAKDPAKSSERRSDRLVSISARSASTSINSSYRERDGKDRTNVFSDYSADDYIISPAREAHVVRIERESRDFYISELTRKSSLIEERLEEVVKDMERLDEENRIKSVEITSLKEDNKSCNDKIAKLDEELRERDALIKKLQAGLPPTSPTHKRVASSKPASPLPKSSAKSKSPGKKSSRSPTIRKKARTPTPPHRRGSLGHGCDLTKQKIFR